MPKQIYTVELDGMRYDIEGDRDPTEQDVRALVGQNIPTQTTEKPFDAMGLVRRAVNPIGGPFMEGIPAAAEAVNRISDISSEAGKKYIGKPVAEFATRNIPTNIPKVGQDIIGAIPNISPAVKPLSRVTNPRQVLKTAIEEGAGMATDPRTYLIPTALGGPEGKLLMKGIMAGTRGMLTPTESVMGKVSKIPDNLFRGGLPKEEVARIATEYGNSNATLVDKIKNLLTGKIDEANIAYKNAVNGFKGETIQSTDFARTVKTGLQKKGWLDLQGNPTTRYKSGLDPVADKLTNLYLDHIQNPLTSAGKKVIGQVMSKEDFLTYRDALGGMLKEKPSDVLVMNARNSLYNSAEKSGMKGIKAARDLEKTSYSMQDKFLNSNTGDLKIANEQALSRVGTENSLSKQQLDHIKELEKYIGHPISRDAETINKINKAMELTAKRKGLLKAGAVGAGLTYLGMGGARKFIQ